MFVWLVFSYIMQIVLHRMFELRRASRNIRGIDRLCVRCTRRCAVDAMCTYKNGHITPFQELSRNRSLFQDNIVTITRVAEMAPNTMRDTSKSFALIIHQSPFKSKIHKNKIMNFLKSYDNLQYRAIILLFRYIKIITTYKKITSKTNALIKLLNVY